MNRRALHIIAGIVLLLAGLAADATAQTIVISNFNNSGFDVYPGPPANWLAATTEGPEFLSIVDPDQGIGTAAFSTWLTPIPDLTGITEFRFDLRLGGGNQVEDFAFLVTSLNGGFYQWDFQSSDLSSSAFTTLVFDLALPDGMSGTLDLTQITTINFASPNFDSQFLDLQMDFGNLVATSVPEPSAAALLSAGVICLLARHRRHLAS